MKPCAFYGEFEQIENGIGMTAKFLSEAYEALARLPRGKDGKYRLKKEKKTLLVCGVSAEKTLRALVEKCNEEMQGLHAEILPVVNEFFGETVTCTGLLTGVDMIKAIEKYRENGGVFDEILLDGNTMKEFEEVFLCGTTLTQMKEKLGFANIKANKNGGSGFVKLLADCKEKKLKKEKVCS